MAKSFKSYDDLLYKRNFIDQVIVRVDLISPLNSLLTALPQKLSQAVLSKFPIGEPRQVIGQEFQVAENKIELSPKPLQLTEWHFHGRNRDKTFVVLPSAVFVTHKSYEKYELIRNEFMTLLAVFFEQLKEAQPSRLGLRYINKIRFPAGDPLDWEEYINPKMLELIKLPRDKMLLSRVFHNIELAFDVFNLRYQFGINNPDYPARIKQRMFVLDLDAYHQGPIDPAEIANSLDKYHAAIQDLFELSISNALRDKMNE